MISDEDDYESGFSWDYPAGFTGRPPVKERLRASIENHSLSSKTACCKFCNAGNLRWQSTEHGWRLFEQSGVMHLCRQTTSKPVFVETVPIPIDVLVQLVDPCATLDEVLKSIMKIRKLLPD